MLHPKLADVEKVKEDFVVEDNEWVVPNQLDAEGNTILDNTSHHKGAPLKKVHAQFGQKWSHTRQIFVTPCGDIKAVSSVIVSILHSF